MTKAWVVYESMFGNTGEVARAVADGLRGATDVEVHEVGHVPALPDDLDVLVVGAPTHAFGLSRPSTREDAATKTGHRTESQGIGLREWLEALPQPPGLPWFAAFDTRVNHPRLPGSAAKKASKALVRLGLRRLTSPESFWVLGTEGPLVAGERERAREWGRELAATVLRTSLTTS